MNRFTVSMLAVGVCLFFAVSVYGQRQKPVAEQPDNKTSAASTPVVSTPIEPDSPAPDSGVGASPQAGSQAIVPRLIKFSGVLRDVTGHPMTGLLDVTFALYDTEAGGDPLWFETQSVQADELGHYTALLGAMHIEGLPVELFTSGQVRWLGIEVGHEPEQQPRVLLVSVPYALKAGDAETLGGKPASAYMLSDSQNAGTSGAPGRGGALTASTVKSSGTGKTKNGAGPLTVTPCTSMTADGAALANQIALYTSACVLGEDAGLVDVGGKIGIGTAAPGYTLDVNGSIRMPNGTGVLYMNDATGAARRVSLWSALNHIYFGDIDNSNPSDLYFLSGGLGGQHFYTNGTEKVTISNGGNVGIGTIAPAAMLEVNGTAKFDGAITFAGGQTFPGTGTITGVTAGSGLTGGASSGVAPLALSTAARTRGINYLAGCESCSALGSSDSQPDFYVNVVGPMTIVSVTCFTDGGTPAINIARDNGGPTNLLSGNLTCNGTPTTSFTSSALALNDRLDFVMAAPDNVAKRITVVIQTTLN